MLNCSAVCTGCQCSACGCNTVEWHGPYLGGYADFLGLEVLPNFTWGIAVQPQDGGSKHNVAVTGVNRPGHFTSEVGCISVSSFESMSATLPESQWSIGSPAMQARNHPAEYNIAQYFGNSSIGRTGEEAFKQQLFQNMYGSALVLKAMIESTRAYNEWGMLLWQLNEVWPTGGWGSLEYGAASTAGQVIGGRWKPLHHILESTVYRNVITSCESLGRCYIRNDGATSFHGKVELTIRRFLDGRAMASREELVALAAGPAELHWFCLWSKLSNAAAGAAAGANENAGAACATVADVLVDVGCSATGSDCMLFLRTTDDSGRGENREYSVNEMILARPKDLILPKTTVNVVVAKEFSVLVTATGGLAVATTLTSQCAGRFESNTFALVPGSASTRTVRFVPFSEAAKVCELADFKATLRVEHVQEYLW